jgi:hypothetical protein
MITTQRNGIMQRWNNIQHELLPELRKEVGALTPKLSKLVHILEWVRIEEFLSSTWGGCGRPAHDRGMLANALLPRPCWEMLLMEAIRRLPPTDSLFEKGQPRIGLTCSAFCAKPKASFHIVFSKH